MNTTKTYRNEQLGFEIDVPKEWSLLTGEAIRTPFGEAIVFRGTEENLNLQVGWSIPEPLDQTEREFRRYAEERRYSELEFGRIVVGNRDHVWARYRMDTQDWAKKYLVYFGDTEYAITANCFDQQRFSEREDTWDRVVASFRLREPKEPRETASSIELVGQAAQYFEQGLSLFRVGRYQKALEQFEKGKLVTHEYSWNFLGVSMTIMQMIEKGAIPEDQIALALAIAEKNLKACLLINPKEQDYLNALKAIHDFKKKRGI